MLPSLLQFITKCDSERMSVEIGAIKAHLPVFVKAKVLRYLGLLNN